jgi:SAM-dependent methyltransferase
MNDRFDYNGTDLPIFDHPYNTTMLNERGVEISIVMKWLSQFSEADVDDVGLSGLEVGNVLNHYFPDVFNDRRIVDKYEIDAESDVENLDVFDIRGSFDYIFSISTIEHVRWDPPEERELDGAARAVEHLVSLLRPGGKMLITVPFGSNPGLDYEILAGLIHPTRASVMLRRGGLWHETTSTGRWECRGSSWYQSDTIWWERYGKSTPWADAVWIGEFER